jgi:hypothetical protein
MTPLAMRIVRELTLPKARRTFDDAAGLLPRMGDIHCFETSEAAGLASELSRQIARHGPDRRAMFLPAPRTWIEMRAPAPGRRVGVLLEQRPDGQIIGTMASGQGDRFVSIANDMTRPFDPAAQQGVRAMVDHELLDYRIGLQALLTVINTPRVLGRRTTAPHRGLERELLKHRASIGHFPLHAYTEIILPVFPDPPETGEPREAHLTGRKALHFCRAHLRVRLARLEIVKAHWRGDPALGIRRGRYRLAA